MPLETATYISDLVPSNPAPSDPLLNGADHIRLTKGTLKATFPNFTDVALNSTQAQIDAASQLPTTGVSVLADAGVAFKTNTTDKITNPAAGEIDLTLAGTLAAQFVNSSSSLTFTWNGALNTTGPISGAGVVPVGGTIMWLTNTLPTTGTWCWANGGVLSRTGIGAALFALIGTTYGAGDGATTFNVPNFCEVVPVGQTAMGGGAARGLITTGGLGTAFGAATVTLSAAQIPEITSSGGALAVTVNSSVTNILQGGVSSSDTGGGNFPILILSSAGPAGVQSTGSTSGQSVASNNTGGAAHSNLQPSAVTNFIIRIG